MELKNQVADMIRQKYPEIDLNDLLDEDQLCKLFRKSKAWAQRSRFEGNGPPFVKAGNKPLYPRQWATAWLLETATNNTIRNN